MYCDLYVFHSSCYVYFIQINVCIVTYYKILHAKQIQVWWSSSKFKVKNVIQLFFFFANSQTLIFMSNIEKAASKKVAANVLIFMCWHIHTHTYATRHRQFIIYTRMSVSQMIFAYYSIRHRTIVEILYDFAT